MEKGESILAIGFQNKWGELAVIMNQEVDRKNGPIRFL